MAGAILFLISMSTPFLGIEAAGQRQSTQLLTGVYVLIEYRQFLLGGIVFFTIFLFPLFELAIFWQAWIEKGPFVEVIFEDASDPPTYYFALRADTALKRTASPDSALIHFDSFGLGLIQLPAALRQSGVVTRNG